MLQVVVWSLQCTGIESAVPLYCCRVCGFATTASWRNAVAAHAVGAPLCAGAVEMMANFTARPEESGRTREPRGGDRTGAATDRRDPAHDPAQDPA